MLAAGNGRRNMVSGLTRENACAFEQHCMDIAKGATFSPQARIGMHSNV
jgi:hypothetical protein